MNKNVQLIECPRDAMQGIKTFIPTKLKIEYINQLLKVGFTAIDFGSFVSHKAIPQLADTKEVLYHLDTEHSSSKLIAIVANTRGAEDASQFNKIDFLGYPFSISETFQLKNTNSTISEAFNEVKRIQDICRGANKQLIIYISMGFGNPYNDPFSAKIVYKWIEKIAAIGVKIFQLSDTIGVAKPEIISRLYDALIPKFPGIQFGSHFHTAPHNWREKIDAATKSGCLRHDCAILGYGGCPMANDELIGNMATENFVNYLGVSNLPKGFNMVEFEQAIRLSRKIFS